MTTNFRRKQNSNIEIWKIQINETLWWCFLTVMIKCHNFTIVQFVWNPDRIFFSDNKNILQIMEEAVSEVCVCVIWSLAWVTGVW